MVNVYVSWPGAPLKNSLVLRALEKSSVDFQLISQEERSATNNPLLQWCTYDDMDHELAHIRRDDLLSSSYTFRKALIRKHYLSHIIQTYLTKRPESILRTACPTTFEIEISYADELEEMWADELWDVGEKLDGGDSWWILKPYVRCSDSGFLVTLCLPVAWQIVGWASESSTAKITFNGYLNHLKVTPRTRMAQGLRMKTTMALLSSHRSCDTS